MKSPVKKTNRKSVIALFTASHLLANSDLVHRIAAESRMFLLEESVRLLVWNKVIEELALEYLVSKKIPRNRRIAQLFKRHMAALFRGDYDGPEDVL